MDPTLLLAPLIFFMRILDVSIGTVRMIYTIRGDRLAGAILGFIESAIWIFAISRLLKHVDNPIAMAAWATGFAAGTVLGMTIERWIASGTVMLRVFAREDWVSLEQRLREQNVGVTRLMGQGRDGPVPILFVVAPRRQSAALLRIIDEHAPDTFVTVEAVSRTVNGYFPTNAGK